MFCSPNNQRKFAAENGYLTQTSKADFWENFVEYVNTWNNLNSPHKWAKLRQEDEATYKNTLFPVWEEAQLPLYHICLSHLLAKLGPYGPSIMHPGSSWTLWTSMSKLTICQAHTTVVHLVLL